MKDVLKLALEAALEALEMHVPHVYKDRGYGPITVIKEALAQPEQEPWMYRIWNDKDAQWRLTDDCSWPAEPIYTTPPKRPWVGLTDEEMGQWIEEEHDVLRWAEAKLKEKNT